MALREHYVRHESVPALVELVDPDLSEDARRTALANALSATSKDVRSLIVRLRNTIEIYTDEGAYANAGDLSITLKPYETANIILVHTVLFQAPAGNWTLRLGSNYYKFTNVSASGYWDNLKMLLKPQDVRSLSWSVAAAGGGDAFLQILGTQLPEVAF